MGGGERGETSVFEICFCFKNKHLVSLVLVISLERELFPLGWILI